MIDLELFLGFPVDSLLPICLKSIKDSPHFAEVCLTEIAAPEGRFIGKKVGRVIDCESLHNVEANIYSLLMKLAPDIPFKKTPLVLFPCR